MFSPFKMRCPECKTPIAIKKESYIGRKVACKECSTKFVIKAPGKKTSGSRSKKSSKRKVANQVGQDSEFMLALDKLDLADESQPLNSLPQAPGRKSKVRISEEKKERKAKKKVPKKKDAISPAVIIGGSILSIAFVGAIVFFGKDYLPDIVGKAEPPVNFSWHTNEDSSFSMKYPEGWEINGGGGIGGKPLWALSKKGSVTIEIRHSMSGSAKGGSPQAGGGGQAVDQDGKAVVIPDHMKPVAMIHLENLRKAENKFDKYEESNTKTIDSGMGECRTSTFTGSKLFRSYKGVRASYLTNRYQLTLYCYCPESDYNDMVPAFMQIVKSVTSGPPRE